MRGESVAKVSAGNVTGAKSFLENSAVRNSLLDDEVVAFLAEQGRRTAVEFGKEFVDACVPLLEWGEFPEYRSLTADGRPRIFVARSGADWWRIRYQIAHELFHWLCTPAGVFHWTHELLAVETAARAMEGIGEVEYARRNRAALAGEAGELRPAAMLTTSLEPGSYPEGLYGRVTVLGAELIAAVGWERVKLLAASFGDDGAPDVARWTNSLPAEGRAKIEAALGVPARDWV